MVEKKEINIYKYEELEESAKEKVLEYFRINEDHPFLEDNLKDFIKEELKKNNIEISSNFGINYSLGNCQGDGLRFTGNFVWKKYNISITPSTHHYVHNKTVSIELSNDDENVPEESEKDFTVIYEKITDDAEKRGYEDIESDNSEEAIKEMIETNDYRFVKDGNFAPSE